MKTCTKCGESKLSTEFFADARRKGKFMARCKKCHNAAGAIWRKANPEKQRACENAWNSKNPGYDKTYAAQWSTNNKDKLQAAREAWKAANQDHIKAYNDKYRKERPEIVKAANAAWLKANRAHATSFAATQRARKRQATPAWANQFFIDEIYDLAHRRRKALGFDLHVDHIVPLLSRIVCGLHCEANLQVIPGKENISKGNRFWPDMPS